MSRIYDALQRASLERNPGQDAESAENADPFAHRGEGEMPPLLDDSMLEKIALHPWRPCLPALPTMGESGESVEQFRGLRTQIYQLREQAPLKSILISSGMPAEGKSFVATNLAMSLARNKENTVLLIDADLRKPALHAILGAPNTPGLTDFLAGAAEAKDILQRNRTALIYESGRPVDIPELTFIPAGGGGDNSSELIANHRIDELIKILAPYFDWILVDSPPVLAVADAIDLARATDAVLLVARAETTPFQTAQRAQAAFSNSRILGFVLNAVKDAPRNGSYYDYYGKHEAGGGKQGRKDK